MNTKTASVQAYTTYTTRTLYKFIAVDVFFIKQGQIQDFLNGGGGQRNGYKVLKRGIFASTRAMIFASLLSLGVPQKGEGGGGS